LLTSAACSRVLPPGETSPTAASPSTRPVGAIGHSTGGWDVLLRFEEGGGFVPPSFLATQAPSFTLYGDGTVIFRNALEAPADKGDGIVRGVPFRIAQLSEDQVQALLDRAINRGALGVARAHYDPGTIADAPTSTFLLNAGGVRKVVSVVALGMDQTENTDAATLTALAALADLLRNFDPNGTSGAGVYEPQRYRGILSDSGPPTGAAIAWPWTKLTQASFVTPPDAGSGFGRRVMSVGEVAALGLSGIEGGLQGATVKDADGKIYAFDLRPLLPDETS
jgi:hypothetical protein